MESLGGGFEAAELGGKKPGEEAAFESEGQRRQLRVDAIEVCPGVPGAPPPQ